MRWVKERSWSIVGKTHGLGHRKPTLYGKEAHGLEKGKGIVWGRK